MDRSSAFTLGNGWGNLESYAGEQFRWVDNDAEIYVAVLRRLEYRVEFHIEPGPSAAARPLVIDVRDVTSGSSLARLRTEHRRRLAFALPVGPPRIYRLRLEVPRDGAEHAGRMLNFRMFDVAVSPLPSDIVPPAAGFVVASGWNRLETFDSEFFRWVDNDAMIEVRSEASFPLRLEIQGGPSLRPGARLTVTHEETGETLLVTNLGERTLLDIPGERRHGPGHLRFHVEGGGEVRPGDPRILNFRAFESPSMPSPDPA